jgi:hypothetical protein
MKTKRQEQQKSWNKNYYENYKEKRREINIKRRIEARDFVNDIKKSGCTRCSEKEIICLDFHHLDPSTKDRPLAQAVNRGWSKERLLKEIAKCILVCSNCHRKIEAGLI